MVEKCLKCKYFPGYYENDYCIDCTDNSKWEEKPIPYNDCANPNFPRCNSEL